MIIVHRDKYTSSLALKTSGWVYGNVYQLHHASATPKPVSIVPKFDQYSKAETEA